MAPEIPFQSSQNAPPQSTESIATPISNPGIRPTLSTASSSSSVLTTPGSSGTNTPLCRIPQYNTHGQPLEVLSRSYPRPENPIDVAEALNFPPQPGTVRFQLAERQAGKKRRMTTEEQRKEEFDRIKKEFQAFSLGKKN